MKAIAAAIVLMFASSLAASAKAYFFTRSELIRNAAVIAIISIEEPAPAIGKTLDPFAPAGASGAQWTYSRQAAARVEKVLKGKVPENFTLYGSESFICARCELSKGRFLAFLTKDGELWAGTNWQLSLRPIRDNNAVEWYVSENQRFPMEYQKLDTVLAQIQKVLALEKGTGGDAPGPVKPGS